MIIWSGRGIWILFVFAFTTIGIVLFRPYYFIIGLYPVIIGLLVTALFSWLAGKSWNSKKEEINEGTGQIKYRKKHSLFWIPMQYWGIILPIIAVIILAHRSIWKAVFLTLFILLFLVLFRLIFPEKDDHMQQNIDHKRYY